jgi:octaprenyl-diphosphate synthase
MARHGNLESTRETAFAYAARGRAALAALPSNAFRARLAELADYVVARIA